MSQDRKPMERWIILKEHDPDQVTYDSNHGAILFREVIEPPLFQCPKLDTMAKYQSDNIQDKKPREFWLDLCDEYIRPLNRKHGDIYTAPEFDDLVHVREVVEPTCICGEINARHCPVHNEKSDDASRPIEKHEWKVWKEKCEELLKERDELKQQLELIRKDEGMANRMLELFENRRQVDEENKELREQAEKLAATLETIKNGADRTGMLNGDHGAKLVAIEALANYQKFKEGKE